MTTPHITIQHVHMSDYSGYFTALVWCAYLALFFGVAIGFLVVGILNDGVEKFKEHARDMRNRLSDIDSTIDRRVGHTSRALDSIEGNIRLHRLASRNTEPRDDGQPVPF